jgi:asparagine synthase (glutamine-hydrolysing)
MCGLAGKAVIGQGSLSPADELLLRRMSDAVAHRGPDGERITVDGPVGFAFRRLALVAPSGGEQPFSDAAQTVTLMANGEIYNHRDLERRFPARWFQTGSDCEVLAHLYAADGLNFLEGVAGMFAIALHDKRRNRLVLARDRFGIKPMFYARCGNAITFGSEIKSLFEDPECPRELDWESALSDQALHASPLFESGPVNTWFRGIELVPAGTIVTIDLSSGETAHRVYWRLPGFGTGKAASGTHGASSEKEIVSAYRDLLAASVADCVSADAEVGLFLSGGVDSSAVAALAACHQQVHTFSVLNGSTFANGDAESAHRVASSLGLTNHQLIFPPEQIPDPAEWKRLLWLLETPQCGPEQYYKYELYRFAKQIRPQLKGMLLGQASDEFNGGYSVQLSGDTGWAGFQGTLAEIGRATALQSRPAFAPWLNHHGALVVSDEFLFGQDGLLADPYQTFVEWKYRDIQQYNCWHEDRTAAGNGVEARVPFLDHRLVELAAEIPVELRVRLLWDKAILREAVRDLLPASIAERPKVSFYHGDGAWHTHRVFTRMLSQDGNALLEEALAGPGAREYLRADAIRSMLAQLQSAREPSGSEFVLRLVNLGLLDQMVHQLPASPLALADQRSSAVTITNWERERETIAARLRSTELPDPGDVLHLGDQVLIMHPPTDAGTLYVAVDGVIEYVVSADEDRQWWEFLRNVDGSRTLAGILDACGVPLAAVADLLRDSLEAGLLAVAQAKAKTPSMAGASPMASASSL